MIIKIDKNTYINLDNVTMVYDGSGTDVYSVVLFNVTTASGRPLFEEISGKQ